MNITRTDLQLAQKAARRSPRGFRPDALPQALFVAEVISRGLSHVSRDDFRGGGSPSKLSELAVPVLVRADPTSAEVEAFVRLRDGAIALVDTGHGHVRIEVAATRA